MVIRNAKQRMIGLLVSSWDNEVDPDWVIKEVVGDCQTVRWWSRDYITRHMGQVMGLLQYRIQVATGRVFTEFSLVGPIPYYI